MKPYQWLAWLATGVLLISATMAAFNMWPFYAYGFIVANTLWMTVGVLWRERSMIWSNLGLNVIYVAGLLLK
jgi:hypothetical protein